MSVTRTLAEIRSTCAKAARGAGCPWGLAEEAGLAARMLEAHGLPGASALAELFQTPRVCPCADAAAGPACGLAEMAALSDALPEGEVQIGPVTAPVLLALPCLMDAQAGSGWRIDWPGGALVCGPEGVAEEGAPAPRVADRVTVARSMPPATPTPPDWRSRTVRADAWAGLEALAARTYVPETEASRTGGAGPDGAELD